MKLTGRILIFIVIISLGGSVPCCAQQSQEQLASHYFNSGDYAQSAELYEVLYKRTSNTFYYQMLSRSYQELGDFKSAEHLIEKRIKQYPKDLFLHVDLGAMFEKKGDARKAHKVYESVIDKIGTDSRQVSILCQAFEAVGHPDYAIKAYLRARQQMQNPYVYVVELATLYQQSGRYEAMMQEYFDLLDNSPSMIGSIQISLQKALQETSNPQLAQGLKQTLISRVQASPNNKQYLEMMIWFSLQQKDFKFAMTQAKAVDARYPDQGGEQLFRVANIAFTNEDYDVSGQCFDLLAKKGPDSPHYFDARAGALDVQFARLERGFSVKKGVLATLSNQYHRAFAELGKNVQTIHLMRNYATLMAYYADSVQEAADMLYDVLELPKLSVKDRDEVKLELGDLLLFAGEVWDASLLYMQVEKANKNDVLGAQAKFKNAKLSYYNHDFEWAKSQLDVLRASTSKLIANDAMQLSLLISDNMEDDSTYGMLEVYAEADLLLYRNQLDSSWALLEEIEHRALSHPLLDEVLLQKAKICIKQNRFSEADTLLQKLVDFYAEDILADDALMLLAQLNEDHLDNPVRARECYENLILNYPSSLYVDRARNHYNLLKSNN